jgi:chromosome segregation ATPase
MRELELKNRELEAEASQHLGRISALRQSHAAVLNSLREEQALDAEEAKRQEAELLDVIAGKEKELEEVRTVRDSAVIELEGLRLRVRELEGSKVFGNMEPCELERKVVEEVGLRTELEDKVESLKRMADQARRVTKREFERAIAGEKKQCAQAVKQVKEEMESVVQEEEKRRAELSWLCREKLEKLELLQQKERREFDAELEKIRLEKEEVEKKLEEVSQGVEDRWNSVITQRTGHEELVAMVQKIAGHLAEEKKKNKRLENSMAKVTEDAWYNVSDSKHEIQKLRNEVEDKNTQVTTLKSDHAVLRKERTEFQQAWNTAEAENTALIEEAENRKLRVEDLEIALDSAQRQLDELRVQSDVHDDLLAKLSETSSGSDDTNQVADLKRDIKLYRSDIRAYRRDLKKRDQLIAVLQNQDDISGFHTPPAAESEQLKRKMEQQQLVLNELEEQVEKLKKEKDEVEENARKQLKKMQQNMLKLNVAGRYRASPLPPLPAGEAESSQAVVQKKAVLGGEGEKKWRPETPPKDQPKNGSQVGDTFEW